MPTADNEKHSGGRLRVGILAPAAEQPALVTAVRAVPELELCAQTGLRQSEALPGVPWFDDPRVMLAQGGVELLVLGVSLREAAEQAAAALDHGVHVWRPPPLGRTFAEATAAARLARRNRPVYRVASAWEMIEPVARSVLHAAGVAGLPSYSDLYTGGPGPAGESWRASRTESGGGVLINDGYELLEGLIAWRGLPNTVSSAVGTFRQRRGPASRDGEDTVAAILRFDDGAIASLRCGWDLALRESWAIHQGEDWSLELEAGHATVRRACDDVRRTGEYPPSLLAADLARAFRMIRAPEIDSDALAAIERHVAIAALIDTIYLAARTHQPESPHKPYEVQGWPLPPKR